MRTLMAIAATVVAACSPVRPQAPSEPSPVAAVTAPPFAEEAACTEKGGEWRPVCRMQQPACVAKFADGGKECSDGDDCAGQCLARSEAGFVQEGKAVTGFCAVNDDPCGCKQTVENGMASAAICID